MYRLSNPLSALNRNMTFNSFISLNRDTSFPLWAFIRFPIYQNIIVIIRIACQQDFLLSPTRICMKNARPVYALLCTLFTELETKKLSTETCTETWQSPRFSSTNTSLALRLDQSHIGLKETRIKIYYDEIFKKIKSIIHNESDYEKLDFHDFAILNDEVHFCFWFACTRMFEVSSFWFWKFLVSHHGGVAFNHFISSHTIKVLLRFPVSQRS